MKKKLLGLICVSLLSLGTFAQTTYSVGDLVNDFTVTDTEGNTHTLYEITASGKHVYLDFFFDTCPPCQATSPIFGEFYDKYGCNSGEVFCLVMNNGSDSDAEVIAYEASYGGPGHHAPAVSADGGGGAVTADFGVGAFPTYILIGPDNRLIEQDIYPIAGIETFEATFYGDFNPAPMPCSFAGIKEASVDGLSIYPNPASGFTIINFNAESAALGTLIIYNIIGEVVTTAAISSLAGNNSIAIDLSALNAGSYIVQIQLGASLNTVRLEVMN